MGISSLTGGSRVDRTSCQPFGSYTTALTTSATANTYTTAVNITGHGYLEFLVWTGITGVNNGVRITIDGVVKVEFGTTSSNYTWVLSRSALSDNGAGNLGFPYYAAVTGNGAISNPTNTYAYPYTPATYLSGNTMVIAPGDGMYFTQSILIEFRANAASQSLPFAYAGGNY